MRFLVIVLLLFSSTISAEIYKWTDSMGRTHFSDSPVGDQKVEKLSIKVDSNRHDVSEGKVGSSGKDSKQVVMYATSWCPYCKKARDYFQENGIDYVEYDIEKDYSAKIRYDALGGRGVPVILVGEKRMSGFSVPRFNAIYN
ncbi:MAG: glutaredoxin domain-containing protein [Gammaproteobacteria bacterium]